MFHLHPASIDRNGDHVCSANGSQVVLIVFLLLFRNFDPVSGRAFYGTGGTMQRLKLTLFVLTTVLLSSCVLLAQTYRSQIAGDVTDPSGAVISGADLTLTDLARNVSQTAKTNSAGHYAFPSVAPGTYRLTVSKSGFRQFVVPSLTVSVAKSFTQNVKLEVGTATQVIEVQATGAELQTLDASVGNVLNRTALQNIPSLSRDVTAVLLLQPMAAPGYNATPTVGTGNSPASGEGNETGGGVAGARSDQNKFLLDGSDVTSDMEATGGYTMGFGATPRAVVPTPVESVEEFRVTTNNDNSFSGAAGGEVQMVTKRGTNAWHGSGYEFNQNTDYNANLWQLNHAGKPRPVWQDNRFGASLGGPVYKDKLWFFANYEGQRLKKATPLTRWVPSASLRAGLMTYINASGGVSTVPLASIDPRHIGISPVIRDIWNKMPLGNNPNEAGTDGLNVIGFDSATPVTQNEDFGLMRLDYKINDNWNASGTFRYDTTRNLNSAQVDIGGVLPGDVLGQPAPTREIPLQPRSYIFGLTGRLSPYVTNDFHFGFVRNFWQWGSVTPFPLVSGTSQAVQIYRETAVKNLVPINEDTQSARSRVWNGKDDTFNDTLSWLKGTHFLAFSGEARRMHLFHSRNDKVVAALNVPILFAERLASRTDFPDSLYPADISPDFQSNFRQASVAAMGMVAQATQVIPRAADLSPLPPGTFITNDSTLHYYDISFHDTWRIKPSFTFSYGVGWGVQTPPKEKFGRQTIMTDAATGQILTMSQYLNNLNTQSMAGQFYAPTLAYAPVRTLGRDTPYDTDWSNVSPRLAFAWNPGFSPDSWLGRIFGEKKSVLRGGYGRYYDRVNGVGPVLGPALSVGFGDGVFCKSPLMNGTCQAGGKNSPADAFRIGPDGSSLTLPTLQPATAPEIPGKDLGYPGANIPFQILDGNLDPHHQNGVNDTWTLSIQRELPSNTVLEIGYVGRYAHHLFSNAGTNQLPYNFRVNGKGQTFAQGFDALAAQVDAGATSTNVKPVPFFENFLAGSCAGFASCTAMVIDDNGFGLLGNVQERIVTDFFDAIQFSYVGCTNGLGPCPRGGLGMFPADNQVQNTDITTSNGNSNYNAGYVSVRKVMTRGLMFQVNYTYAKSYDFLGFTQESSGVNNNDNFRPQRDYGPSQFDRRHVVNLFYTYELPFGKGHRFGSGWIDHVIGGWSLSGDFTASTGIPEFVYNFDSCEEFGGGFGGDTICAPMIARNGEHLGSKAHYNSDGSVSIFGDLAAQTAAYNTYREPFFSDARDGASNPPRGFNRWQLDLGVNKYISITERTKLGLSLQAVNALNHVEFADPGLDLSAGPASFGDTGGTQYNIPRFLNVGVRIDF
jgi:Carboxypeptidase regulatory-like domain